MSRCQEVQEAGEEFVSRGEETVRCERRRAPALYADQSHNH